MNQLPVYPPNVSLNTLYLKDYRLLLNTASNIIAYYSDTADLSIGILRANHHEPSISNHLVYNLLLPSFQLQLYPAENLKSLGNICF